MNTDNIFDFIGPIAVLINGLVELNRLYKFRKYGMKETHWSYNLTAYIKGKQEGKDKARAYIRDINKNWKKYHWGPGLFMILGIPFALWLLYLEFRQG